MNTDPDATPHGFVNLSATDRELCDAIRALTAEIAALAPDDPALYALVHERNEIRQDLVYNRRNRGKR